MARRVTATFSSREAADRAAAALMDLGADRDHISTLARGEHEGSTVARHPDSDDFVEPAREVGDSGAALTTTDEHEAAHGAATGAAIGAVAGIAAGLMSLMVPGFGLITAGGALAWALGGAAGTAAAGAVAGGVYGALHDIGIEGEHARGYEERVRSGDVLLTAVLPSMDDVRFREVLEEHGAEYVTFTEDRSTLSMDRGTTGGEVAPTTSYSATGGLSDASPLTATPLGTEAGHRSGSSLGVPADLGADYNTNVSRGQSKQVEGEMRDRAADQTLNPFDDMAAKAKKTEGRLQEELGEEEEEHRAETRRY